MDENKRKTFCDYKSELLKNKAMALVPHGNSMWPTLKNGKQSVIIQLKTEKLKPMDVAMYQRANGQNVLHRVIKTTKTGYIMCGDSQFVTETVAEDQVYGIMTGFYRGKRYFEATDPEYTEQVDKWYANEFKRKFRVKLFFLTLKIKSLPKRVIRKLFGKKTENTGDGVEQ